MKVPSQEMVDKQVATFLSLFEQKPVWTNHELIKKFNPWREMNYKLFLLSKSKPHGISFRIDGFNRNGTLKFLVGKEGDLW